MSAVVMSPAVAQVLSLLRGVRRSGESWVALCPSHEDTRPSLSIGEGQDGRVLLHCFVGCGLGQLLSALRLTTWDLPGLAARGQSPEHYASKPEQGGRGGNGSPRVAVYPYRDEDGTVLYRKVRKEPKKFFYEIPDGRGGFGPGQLDGIRRVPYLLPDLVKAKPGDLVLLLEGEKDADRARGDGFIAHPSPIGRRS